MGIGNVLQVSVRLSEGGAAGVARNIARELEHRGILSPFAYGYGPHGRASPHVNEVDSTRITSLPIVAINRISYSYRGRDTPFKDPGSLRALRKRLAAADVVHLHIIHSSFVGPNVLFDELIAAGKPVVWTLHDQWAMTGRCAQPGTCARWKNGCAVCPNLHAYPPARIDRARSNWTERRTAIGRLEESLPLALVACADWLAVEAREAELPNVLTIRNSVDREFWTHATSDQYRRNGSQDVTRNLFICRDLRDPVKVDWDVLTAVAGLGGQSLTIVGDNAPREVEGALFLSATGDRAMLAGIYASHDRLIFTSQVDYYPLTIAEAITSGVEVFAIRSRAANEFSGNPLLRIFDTSIDLLAALSRLSPQPLPEADLQNARAIFDPARMTDEYLALYRSLVGH